MTSNSINHASSLSIFLWNANGLKQHSNKLFYLLHHKNIDIALITETHLSTTSNISFNGYSIIRADHLDRTSHGGAAIIIKSSLFYNEIPSKNESYLQAANIKIKINNFNITISSAYFPPNQPISEPKIHSFFP
uniref:RNA-directed DNA polymerase from mobile element jockey n=1 Tax=Sipha flava TaxID=143950 RepID=A0A2S2PUV5_9HEMI